MSGGAAIIVVIILAVRKDNDWGGLSEMSLEVWLWLVYIFFQQSNSTFQQSNTDQNKIRHMNHQVVTRGLEFPCDMSYECLMGVNGTTGGYKNGYTQFLTNVCLTSQAISRRPAQAHHDQGQTEEYGSLLPISSTLLWWLVQPFLFIFSVETINIVEATQLTWAEPTTEEEHCCYS